jgi:hypothetical protein
MKPAIPRSVWMLGFVNLFMDISSELIHSLLPVFMVSSLRASALAVGMVEGVAEATALIAKVFSGTLTDYFGRRKGLAVLGYGLGALSNPLFALAGTVNAVLAARSALIEWRRLWPRHVAGKDQIFEFRPDGSAGTDPDICKARLDVTEKATESGKRADPQARRRRMI